MEKAVTQLTNLEALDYIKGDFGLMAKVIAKLPADDQKKYDDYVTSDAVLEDPSSEWDKFWTWFERLHKSAVQANLRNMCTKTTSGTTSSTVVKSGVMCRACGGIGHYAKFCPSKLKSQSGSTSVQINVAVAKITTKEEYRQHLPETQKQAGNCPCCSRPAHSYSRKFPFGQEDWPSTRLDTCPQFIAKSTKERGELLERIKGCYKCLSWKYQGSGCFSRSKYCCYRRYGLFW